LREVRGPVLELGDLLAKASQELLFVEQTGA